MIKKILLLFTPLITIGQTKVNYKIHYSNNLEKEGLKVEVFYKLGKNGDSTCFHLSNELWGEANLLNTINFLPDENPGFTFRKVPDSNRIIIRHPKTSELHFWYRVTQDQPDAVTNVNRPKLSNSYFHVLGHSLFTIPEAAFEKKEINPKMEITIEWVGFPESFKIHNTFATNQKKQVLKVKLWDEFYNSLFVGGDYRVHSFTYLNKPVYFAIRGQWQNGFSDEKILEIIKRTIPTQREFWKDNNFDYYTVIMSPSLNSNDSMNRMQSTTGSSVKNGFLIQSYNNPNNNWPMIHNLFNHEMMHDWIGGKIKMKHEELNYWFSEGFTDYYAYKNRLRSKEISFKEWAALFNKDVFTAHYKNPERLKPNYILRDEFWKSRNIEKIPYRRGAIFALWLDNQILKKSNYTKSLDDLMRELLLVCQKENKLFTDELFLETAQKYTGKDITYFFQKHVISGVDIEFKNADFVEDFKVEYQDAVPKLIVEKDKAEKYILK